MRKCTICKEERPLGEFNKNSGRKDGLQPQCRECSRRASRKYYETHNKLHRENVGRRNRRILKENQDKLIAYFAAHPCTDCGESDLLVLEFDHLRDKLKNVASLMKFSWARIEEEIAKCEVVCANCHRRRTAKRAKNYRFVHQALGV